MCVSGWGIICSASRADAACALALQIDQSLAAFGILMGGTISPFPYLSLPLSLSVSLPFSTNWPPSPHPPYRSV